MLKEKAIAFHIRKQYGKQSFSFSVKKLYATSKSNVQFGGTLNAGYMLKYTINANNSQQISNIADENYRYVGDKLAAPPAEALKKQTQEYAYDANGNLISIQTGTKTTDQQLQVTKSRRLLWDEENRLLGISDNGFVSQYWYDASGERTVKASFDNEGVYINGALSGARTGTSKFTAYVSPYLVVSNGGNYTKHVYMGSQRITSKVSNSGIFTTSPVNDTLQAKYKLQTAKIKERFDSLGVKYSGLEQTGGLVSSTPPSGGWGANPSGGWGAYFYHPDHLGSSSLITDATGALVQHIQYVPFGEVFIEQRNNKWNTPYKFNGKELDEETGLAYYHARYYDPRTSVWMSVDPLAEKYPNISSYVYCANNPVKYVDPDGRKFRNYRNVYFWGTFVTYNNFSAESGEAFHNTLQSMRGANKLFSKVYSQLDSDLNNTYTFRAINKSNASSKNYTKGEYTNSTKNIDFFFNDNIKNYTDQSTVFEEVFHAGQSQFYSNNYPGSLTIEIEAKVAKAFSGIKTKGGFEEYFPNMKPFLKALVNGNVSNELWGEFYTALTRFRDVVSFIYINGNGNTPNAKARFKTDTFYYDMPYLESLINRSLVPESGF